MPPDPDDELDDPPFRLPLPRDDRIWRHPSELADEFRPIRTRARPVWSAFLAQLRGRVRG